MQLYSHCVVLTFYIALFLLILTDKCFRLQRWNCTWLKGITWTHAVNVWILFLNVKLKKKSCSRSRMPYIYLHAWRAFCQWKLSLTQWCVLDWSEDRPNRSLCTSLPTALMASDSLSRHCNPHWQTTRKEQEMLQCDGFIECRVVDGYKCLEFLLL